MRSSLPTRAPALLLALVAPYLAAQPAAPAPQSVDLRYVGAGIRVGVGYDSDNHLRGDLSWVLREDARSAWIGELWAADRSTGGLQLSYQWRPADAVADAGVRKAFVAYDQNRYRDGKLTLGGGYERENWFASGYAAGALTGRRETAYDSVTYLQTTSGSDGGRPYEQDTYTTVETRRFERPYDYGVGIRFGHFHDGALLRVELGADYEWGRASAEQGTISLGIEKFFAGSPWSVALLGEAYRKGGDYEPRRDDQRITAMLRYEFGGAGWRPARPYRMVEVPAAAPAGARPTPPAAVPASPPAVSGATATPAPATPRIEKRMVKTTGTMASDAFFDFDRAVIRADAKPALDSVAARLARGGWEGNIRITGHTCNVGTPAYNLKLSQRRAAAVRDYLVAAGVPADRIVTEGKGMAEPRFPNDAAGRPKNRRVDVEFVTFEQREETVTLPPVPVPPAGPVVTPATPAAGPASQPPTPPPPAVEWRREEIDAEPAWLRRALHNPPRHKQAVDVYVTQERTTSTTAGERRYLNRGPVAVADAYSFDADSGAHPLDVLANDSDPDGDALVIQSVRAPAHGSAVVSGGRIVYTPAAGYAGPDSFSYTAADAKGATATAAVTLTIVQVNRGPTAKDDFAIAGFNTPVSIDVLANDSDPDRDPLSVVSFTQPANGTVTRGSGNLLVYRAKQDWIGYDTFSYTASDGRGGTASATVTVFADP